MAACACKIPHRLTSAGIISGVAPYVRPGASRGVNFIWRSVLGLLRRAPWILDPPTSLMSYMARSNPGLLVDLMASQMMKSDRALISEPKVKEVFTQSISESLRFGGRGTIAEGALLYVLGDSSWLTSAFRCTSGKGRWTRWYPSRWASTWHMLSQSATQRLSPGKGIC